MQNLKVENKSFGRMLSNKLENKNEQLLKLKKCPKSFEEIVQQNSLIILDEENTTNYINPSFGSAF